MSEGRGILALDLSTRVGWAWGEDNGTPRYGLWLLGPGPELGRRLSILANFLEDFIAVCRPGMVIYEAPLVRVQTSAEILWAVAAITDMICFEQAVPVRKAFPDEVRKLILGRARFNVRDAAGNVARTPSGKIISETKSVVMAWAKARGHAPETDDVADALMLLAYAHILRRSRVMAGKAA